LGNERKKHHCKLQTAKIDETLQRLHISQEFKKHLNLRSSSKLCSLSLFQVKIQEEFEFKKLL
jgi:hypothetical protein